MKTSSPIQFLLGAATVVLVVFSGPSAADSAKETAAAKFVEDLAEQTITILNKDLSDEQLEAALTKLLEDNVAIERIGRVVAGQYLRRMTPAQRVAYDEMYREWVISQVISRFKGYAGEGWILKRTYARKKDVIVRTLITDTVSNETVNCDWRVRQIKGRFQILDVSVAGLSMAATQKSEFSAILSRDGVDGLLAQLQTQINRQ